MTDMDCAQIEESAAEFALGLLAGPERHVVEGHVQACPRCMDEVESFARLGAALLDLIPDTEPPLGFEQKAMAGMVASRDRSRRRRRAAGGMVPPVRSRRRLAAALVAAAVVVAAGVGAALGVGAAVHGKPSGNADATAVFRDGGRAVGTFYRGGRPAWVSMTVHGAPVSGTITCQLRRPDGTFETIGSFDLVHGDGAWSAPEPSDLPHPTGARLLEPDGQVLATANLG